MNWHLIVVMAILVVINAVTVYLIIPDAHSASQGSWSKASPPLRALLAFRLSATMLVMCVTAYVFVRAFSML